MGYYYYYYLNIFRISFQKKKKLEYNLTNCNIMDEKSAEGMIYTYCLCPLLKILPYFMAVLSLNRGLQFS